MAARRPPPELPSDRIGDRVVLSARDVVVGRSPQHHDLSLLKGGYVPTEDATRKWCRWSFPIDSAMNTSTTCEHKFGPAISTDSLEFVWGDGLKR